MDRIIGRCVKAISRTARRAAERQGFAYVLLLEVWGIGQEFVDSSAGGDCLGDCSTITRIPRMQGVAAHDSGSNVIRRNSCHAVTVARGCRPGLCGGLS